MDLQLTGKRAVVTGGSRGIGYAIASALAAEGADLALLARDPVRLDAAARLSQNATEPGRQLKRTWNSGLRYWSCAMDSSRRTAAPVVTPGPGVPPEPGVIPGRGVPPAGRRYDDGVPPGPIVIPAPSRSTGV